MMRYYMTVDINQLNSLALAYIGDAIFELQVREHLIKTGQINPRALQRRAVKFVSANAQSAIMDYLNDQQFFLSVELNVIRRGRNAKSKTIPKNASIQTYRQSTAFEALLGYHYLKANNKRLNDIINEAINFIERNN